MRRPACMDEQEYSGWVAANKDIGLPAKMAPSPCSDCTVAFYLEQYAAGTCDGFPNARRARSEKNVLSNKRARARIRERWAAA